MKVYEIYLKWRLKNFKLKFYIQEAQIYIKQFIFHKTILEVNKLNSLPKTWIHNFV